MYIPAILVIPDRESQDKLRVRMTEKRIDFGRHYTIVSNHEQTLPHMNSAMNQRVWVGDNLTDEACARLATEVGKFTGVL